MNSLQFKLCRTLIGLYFLYFWVPLISYSTFLFDPTSGIFANLPRLLLPSLFSFGLNYNYIIYTMIFFAILLVIGIIPYISSIILWAGFVSFVNYIPYVKYPSEGVIGWLLLVFLLIPQNFWNDKINKSDLLKKIELPNFLLLGAFLVFGLLYSISGYNKLDSPTWMEGLGTSVALKISFSNNNFLTDFILSLPIIIQKIFGWLFLYGELLCLPLFLFKFTRKYTWLILTIMHIGIFLMENIWIVTVPMICFHLFIFNPNWFVPEFQLIKKLFK